MLLVIFMSGCTADFNDISNEYPEILNIEFQTKDKLYIYGYTLEVERNPRLDAYTIEVPPGIGGPEIISKSVLPVGTKFKIYKVQKCSNCFPFPAYTRFLIQFSNDQFSDAPVHFGEYIFVNKGKLWQ